MKLQLTSGGVYEVLPHKLSRKTVRTRYYGNGIIVGIRKGISARERLAFAIQHGKNLSLISRVNFTVLDAAEATT